MDALKRIQFLEDRLHRLSEIGMALSTEKDTDRLFEMILEEAKNITNQILNNLNGSGIYGVEFFVKKNEIIFSELSPRPHDTGMVTLVSQNLNEFELHLRAFLNLPIPKITLLKPSASRVILSHDEFTNPSYI